VITPATAAPAPTAEPGAEPLIVFENHTGWNVWCGQCDREITVARATADEAATPAGEHLRDEHPGRDLPVKVRPLPCDARMVVGFARRTGWNAEVYQGADTDGRREIAVRIARLDASSRRSTIEAYWKFGKTGWAVTSAARYLDAEVIEGLPLDAACLIAALSRLNRP
jgi:hypothetical protein